MEFDKIDATLMKFPYFNVLQKIKENTALLDFMASEKYTTEAMGTYYNMSPDEATVNFAYQNTQGIRGVKTKHHETLAASATDDAEAVEAQDTSPSESGSSPSTPSEKKVSATETHSSTPPTEELDIIITATSDMGGDTDTIPTDAVSQLTHQRSFSDWLRTIRKKKQGDLEDRNKVEDIKAQWQKKRILEMQEDDAEPIDDKVFDMIINSVTENEELVSEPLAELYLQQGYTDKAKVIYHKLILKYPEKSSYFAGLIRKIDS